MIRLALLLALASACALLPACGGDDEPAPPSGASEAPAGIPGDADAAALEVIDGWATTLTAGDVEGAAEFFALPSLAENGPLIDISDEDDALRFNASLPCGAELVRAETQGRFTTATFELTERPGPGNCGPGAGGTAQTAFVIEDGLIVEWRRVGLPGGEGPRQTT